MKRPTRRQRVALGVTCAVLALATGLVVQQVTSPTSGIEPAAHATSAACADAADGYLGQVDGKSRDGAGPTGVATWGHGDIVWRCGLTPLRPTSDPCVNVNGVDWVFSEAEAASGKKTLISYGRTPAVEVTVQDEAAAIDSVLVDVSRMAKSLPKHGKCITAGDVTPPEGTPTPSP